jgi:hypothetical protein
MVGTATFAIVLGASSGHPATVEGTIVMFAAAVAGWIVAIPLILKIDEVSGWRFWLYLGIGTSSGPIIVLLTFLVPFFRHVAPVPNNVVAFMTVIKLGLCAIPFFVGTLTYLLWLRKAQKGVLKRMNMVAVDR